MNQAYSVGIPVRNEEGSIVQTLESILEQSLPPQEVFVCVNGSTDNTYDIVSDMADTTDAIRVLTSSPGKANAWNTIVTKASNNTILFCDGDVTINKDAALHLTRRLEEDPSLVLVGGANAYVSAEEETFFSRYFTENVSGKPIHQNWVCGRLYMTKIKELHDLARERGVALMPIGIINEDGLLQHVTEGHRENIALAYNTSMQVSTFRDWRIGLKRVLSGQKQIQEQYPHLVRKVDSLERLKNYITRFNEIEGIERKIGITSLFVLKKVLKAYYTVTNAFDYNPVWEETQSTKGQIIDAKTH